MKIVITVIPLHHHVNAKSKKITAMMNHHPSSRIIQHQYPSIIMTKRNCLNVLLINQLYKFDFPPSSSSSQLRCRLKIPHTHTHMNGVENMFRVFFVFFDPSKHQLMISVNVRMSSSSSSLFVLCTSIPYSIYLFM